LGRLLETVLLRRGMQARTEISPLVPHKIYLNFINKNHH
jgi:hypothetical protein